MNNPQQAISGSSLVKGQLVSGFSIILLMLLVAGLWFSTVNSVRIKELNFRLKSSSDHSKSVRNSSLVSRFKLLRGREEAGGAQSYAREGRIMQVLADSAYLSGAEDLSVAERAAKLTVDFFDLVAGSPEFRYEKNTKEYKLLEKAFYHEITRSYREAIAQYEALLAAGKKLNGEARYYTLLHRGFCHALLGDRKRAVQDFQTVISESTESEYVATAKELLSMILSIDREISQVDAMPVSTQKGTAYYGLTAYDQAIGTLRKLDNVESNPQALFYLGRALEEKGSAAEAVDYYRKLIKLNPASDWAKLANRRLYALGAFYAAGKEYRQESTKNVEKGLVNDKELLVESQRFQKVSEQIDAGEKKIVTELITPEKKQTTPQAQAAAETVPPEPAKETKPEAKPEVKPEAKPEKIALAPSAPPVATTPVKPAKVQTQPSPPAEPTHDWDKLERLPRAEKIKYIGRQKTLEKLTLENGSQFKGILITEDKNTISLFTMLGRVVIEKSEVESRAKVSQ